MANQNTFHKAAGSTQAVMNNWKQNEIAADDELQAQEQIVGNYAKVNNVSFREARKEFPKFKEARDNYNFWANAVVEMRQVQREALTIW